MAVASGEGGWLNSNGGGNAEDEGARPVTGGEGIVTDDEDVGSGDATDGWGAEDEGSGIGSTTMFESSGNAGGGESTCIWGFLTRRFALEDGQ